jgi:hypothetical protein
MQTVNISIIGSGYSCYNITVCHETDGIRTFFVCPTQAFLPLDGRRGGLCVGGLQQPQGGQQCAGLFYLFHVTNGFEGGGTYCSLVKRNGAIIMDHRNIMPKIVYFNFATKFFSAFIW